MVYLLILFLLSLFAVYIQPDVNTSSTVGHLPNYISRQLSMYPEVVKKIAGDFNYPVLKPVLHNFISK